jgi:hypothetical protein
MWFVDPVGRLGCSRPLAVLLMYTVCESPRALPESQSGFMFYVSEEI